MRLLIVESDPDFREFLRRRFEEKCFAVDVAGDGLLGVTLGLSVHYDTVILGACLPGQSGFEVCADLRAAGRYMPVIMTSLNADVFQRVDGFAVGADDYLVRPCYFEELYARIHALLRRPPRERQNPVLCFQDLTLDPTEQKVRRGKVTLYLTRKEFALLEFFLRNPERILTRAQLVEHVWNRNGAIFSNTVETHIMNLRKKVDGPRKKRLIHSISGRGYKLDVRK